MENASLKTFLWNEQLDAQVAVPSQRLTGPEGLELMLRWKDDKRKENVQEFTALYPHWKPEQVEALVSKFMLLGIGIEADHPVFQTPFFDKLPEDYTFDSNS